MPTLKERADKLISELAKIKLTKRKIKIEPCQTVIDQKRFVEGHLAIVNTYEDNPSLLLPYIVRLEKFLEQVKI